jgi:BatD DUF11 like domain
MNTRFLRPLLCLLSMALVMSGRLMAVDVTTSISTKTIATGKSAILVIKVEDGTLDATPTFPKVKDLIIQPRGQNRQFSMINGAVSNTSSYNFIVGSKQPGTYKIPSITLTVKGSEYHTQEIEITVTGDAIPQPHSQSAGADDEKDRFGFLKCEIGSSNRKHVYVGEIAPIAIKAYFPGDAQASLKSLPRPEGQAFTLHNLSDQPRQTRENIDGKIYTVVTWFGGLSATKEGEYPANISMEANVAIRTRNDDDDQDMFFNPFGHVEQKVVTLKMAEDQKIEVRSLPEEGRPADFSGAIGEFSFKEARIPETMHTGEPAPISALVQGQGSFKLLGTPKIKPPQDWKIYDGKSDFRAADMTSFTGQKVYEFSAIPLKPGNGNVQLSLSYFDPEKGKYEEIQSESVPVRIDGQQIAKKEPSAPVQPEPKKPAAPDLAPLAGEMGRSGSYEPLSFSPWFYPLCGGSFGVATAAMILAAARKRRNDPRKLALKAHQQMLARHLTSAEQAARQGDALTFLQEAKLALQEKLSFEKGMRPEAVTITDFAETDAAVVILKHADSLTYSGQAPAHLNLASLYDQLKQRLVKG